MPLPFPLYWLELAAVAVGAVTGVLAASGQRMDLFGILVLAMVTAVGGGTVRDLCLGAYPIFWVPTPDYLAVALVAALLTFVIARFYRMPHRFLLIADAFGLALFAILGAEKSLQYGSSGLTAILLGVVTGVAGGVLRDVLRREVPLVFRPEIYLYATAAMAGACLLVLLRLLAPGFEHAPLAGMALTLVLRLAAILFKLRLPVFLTKEPP
jgi:uncharacterized membrane protein YeiH